MTVPESEFQALMQRLREGSEDAAWELVDQYVPHIYRAARRTLNRELRSEFDSHDFVQVVWASLFAQPSRLVQAEGPEQFIRFLVAMAQNKTIGEPLKPARTQEHDVTREQTIDRSTVKLSEQSTSREPKPSQIAVAREAWHDLLAGQPSHYQDVIQLRLTGETYDSIARKLNISKRTVQRVLKRLLKKQAAAGTDSSPQRPSPLD